MSKKKPVMSHDPLAAVADVDDAPLAGEAQASSTADDAGSSTNGDAEPTTGDGPRTIRLPSALTISEVAELHAQMLKHVLAAEPFAIDASDVDTVDTAGLQLVAAACKTGVAKGIQVSVESPSEAFSGAARQIGLAGMFGIDDANVAA